MALTDWYSRHKTGKTRASGQGQADNGAFDEAALCEELVEYKKKHGAALNASTSRLIARLFGKRG